MITKGLAHLNSCSEAELGSLLKGCCGSSSWVQRLMSARPYSDREALLSKAQSIWESLAESDWLEAFSAHPRIGDLQTLRAKFSGGAAKEAQEQGLVLKASEETLQKLAALNESYFNRFGFIFIIFASGKSAEFMLEALTSRIQNTRAEELQNAAREHHFITHNRLEKLL